MIHKQENVIEITGELLGKWIGLDSGHKVVAIFLTDKSPFRNSIFIKISGPKLYQVPEGQEMPIVTLEHLQELLNA